MTQLRMVRPHLEDLPLLELPPGVVARTASPADAEGVARVVRLAFDDPSWTSEKALAELLAHPEVDETVVLEEAGQVIATASAKSIPDQPAVGYVHYVATDPAQVRRRLGYRATLAVLHAFHRLGKTEAVLDTDDFRRPAIRVYLDLGFLPLRHDDDAVARWNLIESEMEGAR